VSDDKILRKAFGDIVNGYSVCNLFGETAYILHLGHFSQLEIDSIYDMYYQKAIKQGVPSEKDAIKFAIDNKLWSRSKQDEIKEIECKIEYAIQNKKVQTLPSQIKKINEEIANFQKELQEITQDRNIVLGITAELFSEQKTNHYYIYSSFYRDKQLSVKFFNQSQFDYLDDIELMDIIKIYNTEISICGQDSIKKIALKPFFQNYFYICHNLMDFFGKPAVYLTYNQVSLANYGRYFKNLLENNDKIPDKIKENPDELIDFVTVKRNHDTSTNRNSSRGSDDDTAQFASLPFNATKEDLETLGYDKENSVNLNDVAKAKGGSLKMTDLMKLAGR
jgi:hypothetical protein